MKLQQRLEAFSKLGQAIRKLDSSELEKISESAYFDNPWFTKENVKLALQGLSKLLDSDTLETWISSYDFRHKNPHVIGIVMAGNIPLVGFHDLLCVLLSGNRALLKMSTKDSRLMQFGIDLLLKIEPEFSTSITIETDKLKNFDAIIATGGDNTARYFEYYFRRFPHIIRKNRTSCAVITGHENERDLKLLGVDIFTYFGLGCRNVSKLFLPENFDPTLLLRQWDSYKDLIHHHKYANNYDYQRSILLINQKPFLDNGFVILEESKKLVSPIAVLYFERYANNQKLSEILASQADKLQCIVGTSAPATVSFGNTQFPEVWDFADGIDTLRFLSSLN